MRASHSVFGVAQGSVDERTETVLTSHEVTIIGSATGAGTGALATTLEEVKDRWRIRIKTKWPTSEASLGQRDNHAAELGEQHRREAATRDDAPHRLR